MIDLTIVTPTLNCAKTIRSTLESVRPLTEQGAKHLVVDSHSEDGTRAICEAFGSRVIECDRGNMYVAVNAGLGEAKSEWLTYLNGDDIIYSDAIAGAIEKLGAEADVLYGCIDYMDAQGRFLYTWLTPPPSELLPVFCARVMPIPQQGTLFRAALYQKMAGFDTRYRYSADFDFFFRALGAGARFSRLRFPPMASFRLHAQQISQVKQVEMVAECASSLARNPAPIGSARARLAFGKFRLRNWHNYIIRFLRRKAMVGSIQARSSLFIK